MVSLLFKLHIDFDDSLFEYIRDPLTEPKCIAPSMVLVPVTATIQNCRSIIDNFWSLNTTKIGLILIVCYYFAFVGD